LSATGGDETCGDACSTKRTLAHRGARGLWNRTGEQLGAHQRRAERAHWR